MAARVSVSAASADEPQDRASRIGSADASPPPETWTVTRPVCAPIASTVRVTGPKPAGRSCQDTSCGARAVGALARQSRRGTAVPGAPSRSRRPARTSPPRTAGARRTSGRCARGRRPAALRSSAATCRIPSRPRRSTGCAGSLHGVVDGFDRVRPARRRQPVGLRHGRGDRRGSDAPSARPGQQHVDGVVPGQRRPAGGADSSFVLSAFESGANPEVSRTRSRPSRMSSSLNMLMAAFLASRFLAAEAVSWATRVVTPPSVRVSRG